MFAAKSVLSKDAEAFFMTFFNSSLLWEYEKQYFCSIKEYCSKMKQRWFLFLTALALAVSGMAQTTSSNDVYRAVPSREDSVVRPLTGLQNTDSTAEDVFISPLSFWNPLPLHTGLNAQLSLSTMVAFGKHSPSGVGFGRSVSVVYASPLSKGFSYTLGLNSEGINWGGYRYNVATVGGSLNYTADNRWIFSIEGYKDLANRSAFNAYRPFHPDSYVGGAVGYKFNDSLFLQVSVGSSTWQH